MWRKVVYRIVSYQRRCINDNLISTYDTPPIGSECMRRVSKVMQEHNGIPQQ